MINLPLIAILTTCTLFLAGLYFSYRKGLKLMIYFSALSFFSIIFSYLLFIPLYKPVANLFEEQIFNRFGDPSYDWSHLLVIAKQPIYTIGVSLLFFPVVMLLWGITYFVYKAVHKSTFDKKVKSISKNKNIVVRKNKVVNKLGGVGLGVITTTIVISIPISALTAFFNNHETYVGTTKFLNDMIGFLSFGKLGTPASYIYVTEAAELTNDEKFMDAIKRLISPSSKNEEQLNAENISTLNEDEYSIKLSNLFKEDDATAAFLNTIASKITFELWKPISDRYSTPTDSISPSEIDLLMQGLNWTLDHSQVENIVNWIVGERIESYEETPFFIEWNEAIEEKEAAAAALEDRVLIKDGMVSYLDSIIDEYKMSVEAMNELKDEVNLLASQLTPLMNDRDNKESEYNDALLEYQNKKQIYDDLAIAFEPINTELYRLEYVLNNANSILDNLKTNISNWEAEKASSESERKLHEDEIATHTSTINRLTTEIATEKSKTSDLYQDQETARAHLSDVENDISTAEANILILEANASSAKNDYDSSVNDYNNAADEDKDYYKGIMESKKDDLDKANSDLAAAENTLSNLEKDLAQANSVFSEKQSAYNDNLANISLLEANKSTTEQAKSIANYKLGIVVGNIDKLTDDINDANNLLPGLISDVDVAQVDYDSYYKNVFSAKEKEVKDALDTRDQAESQKDSRYTIFTKANTLFNDSELRSNVIKDSELPSAINTVDLNISRAQVANQELANIIWEKQVIPSSSIGYTYSQVNGINSDGWNTVDLSESSVIVENDKEQSEWESSIAWHEEDLESKQAVEDAKEKVKDFEYDYYLDRIEELKEVYYRNLE